MKKIVVTGGAGFMGSFCIDILKKKNFEIFAISRENRKKVDKINWIQCDLFNFQEINQTLQNIKADMLLHLAWITTPGVFYESDINNLWYESSLNLIKYFLNSGGKKVAVAGSCAEYDWNLKELNESSSSLPQSLYGKSKLKLYNEAKKLCFQNKADLVWGRIFNVYGPGEPQQKIISLIIQAILENRTIECSFKDDIRDFIYVKDVANIFIHLLETDFNGIINLSTGKGISIGELANMIEGKFNVSNICDFKQRTSRHPSVVGDNKKLIELKYRYLFDLSLGLDETIRWWQDRKKSNACLTCSNDCS